MVFRIIPRLDIKGPNLVKGVNLEGLRVLGDPVFLLNNITIWVLINLIYGCCC